MSNLIEFPVKSLAALAWSIIAKDLNLPPDEVRLSDREISVLIRFLRSSEDSSLVFDASVTDRV